jgi:hypothetical protein
VDVPGERLPSELPEYLRSQVAPQVPQRLRAPFLAAVADNRIRSMQNKLMPAAPLHRPGALLLGDAFNMRHPLTGARPLQNMISGPAQQAHRLLHAALRHVHRMTEDLLM